MIHFHILIFMNICTELYNSFPVRMNMANNKHTVKRIGTLGKEEVFEAVDAAFDMLVTEGLVRYTSKSEGHLYTDVVLTPKGYVMLSAKSNNEQKPMVKSFLECEETGFDRLCVDVYADFMHALVGMRA